MKVSKNKSNIVQNHENNEHLSPSPEQQAQLNLIQISNLQFLSAELAATQAQLMQKVKRGQHSQTLVTDRRHNASEIRNYNRSIDLKQLGGVVVANPSTKNNRQRKNSSSQQLNTQQVCVVKRKMPINLSNFLMTGHVKQLNQLNYQLASHFKQPRRSIKMKAYYKRKQSSKSPVSYSESKIQNRRYQGLKLNPIQESYWKIFKGAPRAS